MKKIAAIIVIIILMVSSIGAVALSNKEDKKSCIADIIILSEPVFKENGEYLLLDIKEATSQLIETGKPIIPVISKTYTFPIGTELNNVNVDFDIEEYLLAKKIQPSPQPVYFSIDSSIKKSSLSLDKEIYDCLDLYPFEPYSTILGAGLYNGEHVIYLTIRVYIQYSPSSDKIYIPENIKINIYYKLPETSFLNADEYDMLIITDEKFVASLQPLVTHKNDNGIRTVLETVQDIYPTYNGRDNPEDIKLRIKDAVEEWGIKYVLLAGGRKGQTLDWYIPERRTNNGDDFEGGYSSDLYYADLYKYENDELVFEDWDSNDNDIFAEFSNFIGQGDIMDYYPDVSVGRLPFRYNSEIDIVVSKIIEYENNADDSWFKDSVVIGGDGGPPARGYSPGIYEDELEGDFVADMLESIGFNVEKLYTSLGSFSSKEDVINAISDGAGFVHMSGHGNPAYWGNFLPDAESEEEMIDGLLLKDMNKLVNDDELPVITVGGCHNAQFNVSMMNFIEGIKKYGIGGFFFNSPYRIYYMEWVPRCFCTWLVFQKGGGAISSIGNTGLGIGYVNNYWNIGLSGWILPRFYDAYVNQSKDIIGEAHDQAIIDYINIVGGVNSDHADRKTIEEWALIGDPSLQLGGI